MIDLNLKTTMNIQLNINDTEYKETIDPTKDLNDNPKFLLLKKYTAEKDEDKQSKIAKRFNKKYKIDIEDYIENLELNFVTLTLKEMGFSKELINFISTLSLNNQSKVFSQIMDKVDEEIKEE
jgi:thymidylate synthase ThyX